MFPGFEESYLKTKTKNDGKLEKLSPGESDMRLAHEPCAYDMVFTGHAPSTWPFA